MSHIQPGAMLIWDCFFVVFFWGDVLLVLGFPGSKWVQPSLKLAKSAPENKKGRLNPEKVQQDRLPLIPPVFFCVLSLSF